MRTAANLGLRVAETNLEQFGNHLVFVTRRYDRVRTASGWRRLHQEDMCQSLSIMPEKKYQSDGGPGVSALADRVNSLTATRSRTTFFDALAFNVGVGNTDAHAKNYSVLTTEQATAIAPLYDAGSIYGYRYSGSPKSAMKIGKHYSLAQVSQEDWMRVGHKLGIPAEESTARVRRIQSGLLDAFDKSMAELPSEVDEVLMDRAKQLAVKLAGVAAHRRWVNRATVMDLGQPTASGPSARGPNGEVWVAPHRTGARTARTWPGTGAGPEGACEYFAGGPAGGQPFRPTFRPGRSAA